MIKLSPGAFGSLFVLVACGSSDLSGDLEKATKTERTEKTTQTTEQYPPEGSCIDEVTDDIWAEEAANIREANAQRDALYKAAIEQFDVTPVVMASPEREFSVTDPYPNAVAHLIGGADTKPATKRYETFHGFSDKATIYETAIASQSYFLIDSVGYDGTGREAAVMMLDRAEPTKSLHAWHVSSDNRLMRIKQIPEIKISKTIQVCGCAPGLEEVPADDQASGAPSNDMSPPSRGLFLLPGTAKPTLLQTHELKYSVNRIEFQSNPRPGTQCVRSDPMVAC